MGKHELLPKEKFPKLSISSLVQRGNDLTVACRQDRLELEAAGLRWEDVERLGALLQECSVTDALFKLEQEDSVTRSAALKKYVARCRRLRNKVVRELREAANSISLPLRIPNYSRSFSRSELVQDLNDLSVLCRTSQKELEEAGFDMSLAESAYEESQKLSLAIARTILDRETADTLLRKRNALCQHIFAFVSDICSIARLVFSKHPRIQNYYSSRKCF